MSYCGVICIALPTNMTHI